MAPAIQTPYKMWTIRPDGTMEPVVRLPGMVDSQSVPRQMLPMVFWQCGYVDVVRSRAVLDKLSMWGERVLAYRIDDPLFEIDYPENVPAVEQALLRLLAGGTAERLSPPVRHPV